MALRSYKLLDQKHTRLITTGKVPTPRGQYGYGFGEDNNDGKRSVGHNGGAPGIATTFQMYPDTGYTVVLLMNGDPPAMMPIVKAIRERIPAK